ncbi:hypothetical protein, partial [Enterobacter asburiae]
MLSENSAGSSGLLSPSCCITLGFSNLHNESQTSGNGYTVALSGSAGGSGNGENRNLAPAIGTGQAEESHTGTTSS